MTRASLPIRTISEASFAPYGDVLDLTASKPSNEGPFGTFQIITRSESPTGWRLAVLKFSSHQTSRLEEHPESKESFEPVSGISVLCLAVPEDPSKVEAFLLDKPVCLNAGVWHDVFALSDEAVVKIAENLDVGAEFYELESPLSAKLIAE
jgi:ureidoglycolate hydrolase